MIKKASRLQVIHLKANEHIYEDEIVHRRSIPYPSRQSLGIKSNHYIVLDHPDDAQYLQTKLYKV